MYKNILNKNMIIYSSKNLKNHTINLIILSINLGWGMIRLNFNKNNNNFNNILLGYSRIFVFFFKLKGFGYKWKYKIYNNNKKNIIYFKLGFTHRISLIIQKNFKSKLTKKRYIIKSRSYKLLRTNLNFLFILYKKFLYNKKGIFLRGTKYKIKISKKKSKF